MVCEGQAWWTGSGGVMVCEREGHAFSVGQAVSWFVRVRPVHLVRWCRGL